MFCECCGKRRANQSHHKFHNVKWARKLYKGLMDNELNLQRVCEQCHVGHNSLGLIHLTEEEFCLLLGTGLRSKLRETLKNTA